MKQIYSSIPGEHITEDARVIDQAMTDALRPIFAKYKAEGYSVRQLMNLAHDVVTDVGLGGILDY
jgi:hypothetical protein